MDPCFVAYACGVDKDKIVNLIDPLVKYGILLCHDSQIQVSDPCTA